MMLYLLPVLKQHSRQVALFRCACTNCNAATCVFYTRLLSMTIWLCWWWSCCSLSVAVIIGDLKLIGCFSSFESIFSSFWNIFSLEMFREFHSTNYVTRIIFWNIFTFNEANPMKTTFITENNRFPTRSNTNCLLFACHQSVFEKRVYSKYNATNTLHLFWIILNSLGKSQYHFHEYRLFWRVSHVFEYAQRTDFIWSSFSG